MSLPDGVTKYSPRSKLMWHAARAKCVTASVAGALLGLSPYTTLYRLWAEKSERIVPDHDETPAMRKGRVLEPGAVELAREDCPSWQILYKRANIFYRNETLRIGATPDAFGFRPDKPGIGIIQVKIVSEEVLASEWTEDDGSIVPPEWIMVQALVEAKMTGAQWASVYVMAVGRAIVGHMVDIPLLDNVWNLLLHELDKFWKLVDSGVDPSPDWERDAQAVAEVYRRSKPSEVDMLDEDLDKIVGEFEATRQQRLASEKLEEVLKAKVLYGIKDNEVVNTRSYRVKATSSVTEAGNRVRRITIRERK